MLKLRRGAVVEAGDPLLPVQRLVVDVEGELRAAVADTGLVGPAATGDEVVINVEAVDLALGSGGADIVHVNLSRGLHGSGPPAGVHVMKLNYTSLQHAVAPVEEGDAGDPGHAPVLRTPLGAPVGVFFLHGQLAPACWAIGRARRGTRVGYVQTAGGALPGAMSDVVRELRERGLLAVHVTAGPSYGGEREAITTAGAIHHLVADEGLDAVLCGPGPGILGSASALGHGGMTALDTAHAALALGCPVVLVPRMSSGDPRERHRGLSHHTGTVLRLLLAPVTLPLPTGEGVPELGWLNIGRGGHTVEGEEVDLDDYAESGLPARTMGRSVEEDPLFFAAALAGGAAVAGMMGAA